MNYIDKINSNAGLKLATAYEVGLEPLDVKHISSFDDLENNYNDWDVYDDVAIKRPAGIDVTCHAHWNGEKYACWIMSISDDWLLAGRQGIELMSNCFTMFSARCNLMDGYFKRMVQTLERYNHIGFVNISITFVGDKPKYRDVYFGATEMFAVCLEKLYGDIEIELFKEKEQKRKIDESIRGFSGYMRVHGYPYHPEQNRTIFESIPDEKKPELFWFIDSYTVAGRGDNISELWKALYSQAAGLREHGVCWRIDGDKKARQTFYNLKQKRII